jgi:hypothetical protein
MGRIPLVAAEARDPLELVAVGELAERGSTVGAAPAVIGHGASRTRATSVKP